MGERPDYPPLVPDHDGYVKYDGRNAGMKVAFHDRHPDEACEDDGCPGRCTPAQAARLLSWVEMENVSSPALAADIRKFLVAFGQNNARSAGSSDG